MLRILAANTVHVSYITENCLRRRNRLERARASYDKHEQFRLRESCIGRNGNVGRAYTYNATLGDAIHPWAVISLLLLPPHVMTDTSVLIAKFLFPCLVSVIKQADRRMPKSFAKYLSILYDINSLRCNYMRSTMTAFAFNCNRLFMMCQRKDQNKNMTLGRLFLFSRNAKCQNVIRGSQQIIKN